MEKEFETKILEEPAKKIRDIEAEKANKKMKKKYSKNKSNLNDSQMQSLNETSEADTVSDVGERKKKVKNGNGKRDDGPVIKSDYKLVIDTEATLYALNYNYSIIKYTQQGLINDKMAFQSMFVNQVRCYFLIKSALTQILLQTLVYSPQI